MYWEVISHYRRVTVDTKLYPGFCIPFHSYHSLRPIIRDFTYRLWFHFVYPTGTHVLNSQLVHERNGTFRVGSLGINVRSTSKNYVILAAVNKTQGLNTKGYVIGDRFTLINSNFICIYFMFEVIRSTRSMLSSRVVDVHRSPKV